MRFRRVLPMTAALVAALAATGSAALSDRWAGWGSGPAQILMTADEAARWKVLASDADAEVFVKTFWAKRDPSPGTERNELRDEFEARVKVADEKYTVGGTRGSMSDRGKVLILFGPATSMQKQGTTEIWTYDGEIGKALGGKTEITFVDYPDNGDLKIEGGPQGFDFEKARLKALGLPSAEGGRPAPIAGVSKWQADVDAFRAGKTGAYKPLSIAWGEYVTARGETYVPVLLYVPKGAGLDAAAADLRFFGVVTDTSGQTLGIFDEPATLTATRNDLFVDKSLALPRGKHVATFGIAQGPKALAMATTEMELAGELDSIAPGVSSLILSNNVYTLSQAQSPVDPFAFGGVKVVPKADRTFVPADELWYFFELRNPALDEERLPRIQVRIDLEGTTGEGKKVTMTSPSRPADAQPLKGVPGHYGIGSAIPLSAVQPGEYTLKVKVTDTVRKSTYNLQESFKVIAEGR